MTNRTTTTQRERRIDVLDRIKPYALIIGLATLMVIIAVIGIGQAGQNAYMDGYRSGYSAAIAQGR